MFKNLLFRKSPFLYNKKAEFSDFSFKMLKNASFLDPISKLKAWWHKRKLHPAQREKGTNDQDGLAPWETDYSLLVCEGLFDEYLEMGELLNLISFPHLNSHTDFLHIENISDLNAFIKLLTCYINTRYFLL